MTVDDIGVLCVWDYADLEEQVVALA